MSKNPDYSRHEATGKLAAHENDRIALIESCAGARVVLRFGLGPERQLARESIGKAVRVYGPGLYDEHGGFMKVQRLEVISNP